MPTNPSANMNLPVPVVGQEAGPQYAVDINDCLTLLDAHDHSPGSGVQITPSGLNINADLSFQSNDATLLRSARFDPQGAVLAQVTDIGCVYVVDDDLYYNDGVGNQIRLTQSGSIVGTSGSITGLVAPASASYVSASSKFVFQSNVNTAANIDGGSFIMRNISAGSNALTLSPPASLPSNYTILLPALPGSGTKFVTLDSSGNMVATRDVDNSTLEVSGTTLRVKDAGITNAKIAAGTIEPDRMAVYSDLGDVTTFTASGTYNVPANVNWVMITGSGGGGGGGGNTATAGGGGGGGSLLMNQLVKVTPGGTVTVTIGAGGAGGATNADGNNGASSFFGSFEIRGGGGGITTDSGTRTNMINKGGWGMGVGGRGGDSVYLNSTNLSDFGFAADSPLADGGNPSTATNTGGGGGAGYGAGADGTGTAAANTGAGGGGGNNTQGSGNGGSGILIVTVVG